MSVIICRTSERNQRDANRHVNNISTARLISNNSRKWFLARLIKCAVIIICAAPQAVHSLDASDVVTVPCGAETIYGPAVAHNTTFVLRDCYNTTTASVTGLTIHLNASSGALTGLSIVVENSNQVYVIVHSLSTTSLPSGQIVSLNANISNMNVTFRNVTNDINLTGNSMFRVDLFSVVSNLRIKIGDVRHSRDTNIIKLNWVDSLSRILVLVTNVSLTGNGSLITFDTIVDALRDSTVSMVNVTSSSPLVIIQRAFDVTLPVYTIFAERIQIYLVSCIMSGTARSGDGYLPFLVHFRNTHIDARSNITIADFQMRITSASLAGALLVQNADLGNVYVSIVNFTCIVPSGIAYAVLIQNSTVNWAAIAIDSALISGVNASRLFGFLVVSSAVANSHLFATNVSLGTSHITTRMYLMSVEYSATVGPKPSLSNTSITISNCNLDGVFSMVLYVVSASISATDISILHVAMAAASQYLPIILSSPPGTTDGLTLSVLDSYVVGAYPLRLEALTAVNSNIVVAASTLVITQGGNFPGSPLFALTISTAVLTNTTVTVSATDIAGVPYGVNAGWIVCIQSCTFSGVNASLSFASLTKSGGILYVGDSVLDSATTVTAAVASSITIPSGFPNQVFYVLSTAIRKNSTLKLLLPPLVRMDAASSTTAGISALYIAGSTLSELSSIQVSGVGPGTHLQWPNGTLWLDSCNVPKDCSIHLSNLVVTGTDANIVVLGSTPSAVLMVENCSFAQLRAAMQSRQFIAIVAPTVSASLNAAVFLMRCTFTTAAWDPQIQNALVALSGFTSKGNASCTLMFESDQLTLFGVNLLIGVTTPNNSQTTVLVTSVVLRCGWWGRYSFTSSLSPIHLAMKGNLLRGENTAITPVTTVAAVSGTLLAPAPSAAQCALPWNNDGGSWTSTETRGLASITFANTVSTYHPTHTVSHDPSNSREKTSHTSHLSSSRTFSNAKSVTLALFRTLSSSDSNSRLSNSVVRTVSFSEETPSHTSTRPLLTESSPESTTPRFHHSLTPTVVFSGTNISTSLSKKARRSFSFTTFEHESLQSSTATRSSQEASRSTDVALASPSLSPSSFASAASSLSARSVTVDISHRTPKVAKSLTTQPFLSTTMTGASPLTSTSTHITSTTPTTLTSVTQSNIVSPSDAINSTLSVSIDVPSVELVLGAPAAIQAAALISAAAAVVSGGGAVGDAATIATLSMMTCSGKKTWDSNTGSQRLVVSAFYDLGPGAAMLGNAAVAMLFFAGQSAFVRLLQQQQQGLSSLLETRARYPGLSWTVFLFLISGTLFSAVSLFSAPEDAVLGHSVVGRAFGGGVAILLIISVAMFCVVSVARATWRQLYLTSISDVLCEPHVPWWFMRLFGPWLLPRVMWEPNELKLRYGDFFSSVASTDALVINPILQLHGAVFSLIAAVPFPQSACAAQFVLAIVWMCVPVVLVLRWRLRLLRRPPSNPLVLLNNVTVVGVLLATLVFVEGPASSQSAAASVRDVLGYVLTVVSVVKTVLTIVSVVAEGYAKRSHQTSLHKVKEQVNGELQSQTNVLYWLSEAADSQEFSEPQAADRCALQLACVAASPALVLSAGSSLYYRTPPRRSLNTAALDAQIDHLLQHSLYAPLVQHCPSEHDPVALLHQHLQQQKQWNRAQQFTLKLLITRAARNAKFFDAWKPWDQEMGRDK